MGLTPDTDPTGLYGNTELYGAAPTLPGVAPPPPPAPPATGGGGGPPSAPPGAPAAPGPAATGTYTSDPILQMIVGPGGTAETDTSLANASLLDAQKRALMSLGSRSLAETILGPEDPFLSTITDDPFSGMSQLAKIGRQFSYDPRLRGLGWQTQENLNQRNLFYSGERGLQEAALGRSRLESQFGAEEAARNVLEQARAAWLDSMRGIRDRRTSAEADAYNRWLAKQIQAPTEPGTGAEPGAGSFPDTSTLPPLPEALAQPPDYVPIGWSEPLPPGTVAASDIATAGLPGATAQPQAEGISVGQLPISLNPEISAAAEVPPIIPTLDMVQNQGYQDPFLSDVPARPPTNPIPGAPMVPDNYAPQNVGTPQAYQAPPTQLPLQSIFPEPQQPAPPPVAPPPDPYANMIFWPGYGWQPVGWQPPVGVAGMQ